VKVHFTTAAVEQLDGIYAYIAADSVKYAQQVIDRILEKANNVALFPQAAAVVPEYSRPDVREVFAYHYRIIYLILPEQIDVLAVVHGAKPLPPRVEDLS
jgi:toxin ParE1/3/4